MCVEDNSPGINHSHKDFDVKSLEYKEIITMVYVFLDRVSFEHFITFCIYSAHIIFIISCISISMSPITACGKYYRLAHSVSIPPSSYGGRDWKLKTFPRLLRTYSYEYELRLSISILMQDLENIREVGASSWPLWLYFSYNYGHRNIFLHGVPWSTM